MKKLKIGKLYEDETVRLARSASGTVSFWCNGPIQIWTTADGELCVNTIEFREHADGSLEEIDRHEQPVKP